MSGAQTASDGLRRTCFLKAAFKNKTALRPCFDEVGFLLYIFIIYLFVLVLRGVSAPKRVIRISQES